MPASALVLGWRLGRVRFRATQPGTLATAVQVAGATQVGEVGELLRRHDAT